MSARWITANPPKADLIAIDTTPAVVVNNSTMQRYVTPRGYWWARIVQPGGFTYWVRLVNVE